MLRDAEGGQLSSEADVREKEQNSAHLEQAPESAERSQPRQRHHNLLQPEADLGEEPKVPRGGSVCNLLREDEWWE